MHTQKTGRQITPSTGSASEALAGRVKSGRGAALDPVLRRVGGGAVPASARSQPATGLADTRTRRVLASCPARTRRHDPTQTLCRLLGHARGARRTLTTR